MLRNFFVHPVWAVPVNLRGRRIVVTGASPRSIGYATARTLADWGATVAISTRSGAAETADAINAELTGTMVGRVIGLDLDLCNSVSIARYVEWLAVAFEGQVDVLVNNAGIHLDLRSQWKTPRLVDDDEIHWRTNYLGTMELTHRLVPFLCSSGRRTGDARIVNVVSMLHAKGRNEALFAPLEPYDSWTAYGTSKLALVHATFELDRRMRSSQVRATCLHPGAVFSRIADKGLEGSRTIAALRRTLAPAEAFFLLNIEEGAQTSIHCASSPTVFGGAYYRDCEIANADTQALDAEVSSRLWHQTLNVLLERNGWGPRAVKASDAVT